MLNLSQNVGSNMRSECVENIVLVPHYDLLQRTVLVLDFVMILH
jgi:hypothetical protein